MLCVQEKMKASQSSFIWGLAYHFIQQRAIHCGKVTRQGRKVWGLLGVVNFRKVNTWEKLMVDQGHSVKCVYSDSFGSISISDDVLFFFLQCGLFVCLFWGVNDTFTSLQGEFILCFWAVREDRELFLCLFSIALAQNNPCDGVAYFWRAYTDPLRILTST